MSAFFRAKKKMVSLAGGSGAGRKIIKSNLGDDGVILLRILKTVTLKLYGNKKQSRVLKKSIMKYAVKGGYLYKQNKLTASDAKGMSLPMERLFKHAIDATESDGGMETTATTTTTTTEAAGESKSGSSGTTTSTTTTEQEHQESDDDDDDDAESDDDVDVPVCAASSSTTVVATAPPQLLPHVIGMSNNLKVSGSIKRRERENDMFSAHCNILLCSTFHSSFLISSLYNIYLTFSVLFLLFRSFSFRFFSFVLFFLYQYRAHPPTNNLAD